MATVKRAKKAKAGKNPDKNAEGYWVTAHGTVITPEVEERWAQEAERGYDLSKAKRVRVGRPPLDGVRASERVTLRIPPDLYDAAKAKADRELRSISHLAREALKRYVES